MRQKTVSEALLSAVRFPVRELRGAQQGEINRISLQSATVLAVIQQGRSEVGFRKVRVLVNCDFKACPVPAGVGVRWTPDEAEGNVGGAFRRLNRYREGDAQQLSRLTPVDGGHEVETAGGCSENHTLNNGGTTDFQMKFGCVAHTPACDAAGSFGAYLRAGAVPVGIVDIPRFINGGAVDVKGEGVAAGTGGDEFPLQFLVERGNQLAAGIEAVTDELVFQNG